MNGIKSEIKIDRQDLIKELLSYKTTYSKEREFIGCFLELMNIENCFYRDCFPGQITASALLINQSGDQILMNHHKSLQKWLCFGGHADGDEDTLRVAIRETMEESGITMLKPISANFYDIDIHKIPTNNKKNEPEHLHYDVRYIMQMTGEQTPVISNESTELKWMSFDEANAVIPQEDGMIRLIEKAKESINK